jgi:hypothetical protein
MQARPRLSADGSEWLPRAPAAAPGSLAPGPAWCHGTGLPATIRAQQRPTAQCGPRPPALGGPDGHHRRTYDGPASGRPPAGRPLTEWQAVALAGQPASEDPM